MKCPKQQVLYIVINHEQTIGAKNVHNYSLVFVYLYPPFDSSKGGHSSYLSGAQAQKQIFCKGGPKGGFFADTLMIRKLAAT